MTVEQSLDRRHLLALLGSSAALAGCVGGDSGGDNTGNDTSDDGAENFSDVPDDLVLDGVALSSGFPVVLFDPDTEERLADIHYHENESFQHWHSDPLDVPTDEWRRVGVRVNSHDGGTVPVGEDGDLQVELEPADTTSGRVEVEVRGDTIRFRGVSRGTVSFDVHLIRNGERAWTAPDELDIRVS
jgi:hypothetical protein